MMNDENNLSSVYEEDEDTFDAGGLESASDDINDSGEDAADLDAKMESAIATAQGKREPCRIPRFDASNYILNGQWDADQAEFKKEKPVCTGFSWFDSEQKLYPGLHILAAVSSLGKTSLMWQMSEQIAMGGHHVLYFSSEQTRHELYAKSFSRRIYTNKKYKNVYTAIQIRLGAADGDQALAEQKSDFAKEVEDRLHVYECGGYTTVEDIIDEIDYFMEEFHEKPVVVIDYLQNIYATEVNGRILSDQRFNIDHIVTTLKDYQKQHKLIVIAIASVNRENYMLPVDASSLKESSKIEYSADAIYGLNLALIMDKDFESKSVGKSTKDTTVTDKRRMISKAYEAPVRDIVLKAVKNRFGRASFTVYFTYEAAYDNFIQGSQIAYAARKKALQQEVAKEMAGNVSVTSQSKSESKDAKNGPDVNDFMADAFSKKG